MFDPQIFLSFSQMGYNLKSDEIIIIQSLLNNSFFDNLIPLKDSKYVNVKNYDNINPNISISYSPVIDLKEKEETPELEEIESLPETIRGEGGFGSTGK